MKVFAPINIMIVLSFLGSIVWLQLFLSKKKNKRLGLILPKISLVFSLIMIFGFIGEGISDGKGLGRIISILLITNIPTIVFIIIYHVCREKMNIHDLN